MRESIRKNGWQSRNAGKKRCAAVLAAVLTVTGAAAGMPAAVCAEENEAAMGRYLETDIALPEEMELQDVVRTAEGTIRIIGRGGEGYALWDSADGGASWEQTGTLAAEYANEWFTDAALNPNGGCAVVGLEEKQPAEGQTGAGMRDFIYYMVSFDAQGNVLYRRDIEEDSVSHLCFTQNGQLIGRVGNEVMLFDGDTGETAVTFSTDGAEEIGICGEEVLLLTGSRELQRYDTATGEPLPRDEALDEALFASGKDYIIGSSISQPIVMAEDEDGRLCYCTDEGIFVHRMGGTAVEKVVDGEMNSMTSPSMELCALAAADQCFYLICYDDGKSVYQMMKYEYSADTPSMPQKELTVYSLMENAEIRQAAAVFQKQYPDTYVNYEIGMSGENGVTAADALRTLNTELLAGSGPDVLLLDNMAADTYAAQGLLTDLSEIAAEVRDSDGLLDNVAGAYEQDGFLPLIPAEFGILTAAGDPALLDGLNGTEALEELAAQQGALSVYDIGMLREFLYRVYSGSWENEDHTLNQERLSAYVNAVKHITDTWKEYAAPEDLDMLAMYEDGGYMNWNQFQQTGMNGDDLSIEVMDIAQNPGGIHLGTLYDIIGYCGLTTVNKQTGMCALEALPLTEEKLFVPCCMLSILSTSREPERAADFVKYMLSREAQENLGNGFPVNRTALEHTVYDDRLEEIGGMEVVSSDKDGSYFELTYEWPSREECDALFAMAEQATVPVASEQVQHDVVMEEMKRCLNGETGTDETVNAILQRINLYLAE